MTKHLNEKALEAARNKTPLLIEQLETAAHTFSSLDPGVICVLMREAAHALTVLSGDEWLDIKDGGWKPGVRVLLWVPPYGPSTGSFHEVWHCHSVLDGDAQPTHWQPLPAPPKGESA